MMTSAAETIARSLGLRRAGREFTGKCPSCGYASGFTVTERNGAILLYCHAGGCSQAELWGVLEEVGLGKRKGRREAAERCQPTTRRAATSQGGKGLGDQSKSQAAALAIWRRSRPAYGTIVETYLRECRGYTGPLQPSLRFATGKHRSDPECWHPIMVSAVLRDGCMIAVHRTFLRQDGRGKADLDPNKMTLGPCKGGAVPLAPAGPVLAVAEGIETAMSYMEVTGTPTWAALSAGGIRNLVLPECVCEVVIAADPDPVGIMAAHAAARSWLREGLHVSIARPPMGCDFNDLARAS
jgi:hypothetical protein